MSRLFLLTESDYDDPFYEALAERITGLKFEVDMRIRPRRARGKSQVYETMNNLIRFLKHHEPDNDAFFLISVDNDGLPGFPEKYLTPTKSQENPYSHILGQLHKKLGSDPTHWPVKGALAIPVEMIESWILLGLCDDTRAHSIPTTKLELKKRIAELINESGVSKEEFMLNAALTLDLDALITQSLSFNHFSLWLKTWTTTQ